MQVSPAQGQQSEAAPRPNRSALNQAVVLTAALALLDEVGAEKFSMRKLGQHLGVDPMAVYHYFPSKAALFDALVEGIWNEVAQDQAAPAHPPRDWQKDLLGIMCAFRTRLLAHPHLVTIVGTRPIVGPGLLRLVDQSLGRLRAAGLTLPEGMELLNCVVAFTVGHVLAEVTNPVGGAEVNHEAVYQALSPQEYPVLAELFHKYEYAPQQQFEHGLEALVAGWGPAH